GGQPAQAAQRLAGLKRQRRFAVKGGGDDPRGVIMRVCKPPHPLKKQNLKSSGVEAGIVTN
uniref:hypothetical protein n=1 Tax=Aeromonas veronii TaxID=654 RepID=UPI003D1A8D2F